MQRVSIDIVQPFLEEKLVTMVTELEAMKVERAVILEWIRNKPAAAPTIQRIWRGVMKRNIIPPMRQTFWLAVEFSVSARLLTSCVRM